MGWLVVPRRLPRARCVLRLRGRQGEPDFCPRGWRRVTAGGPESVSFGLVRKVEVVTGWPRVPGGGGCSLSGIPWLGRVVLACPSPASWALLRATGQAACRGGGCGCRTLEKGGLSRMTLTTCTVLVFQGGLGSGVSARAGCPEQLCVAGLGGLALPSHGALLELGGGCGRADPAAGTTERTRRARAAVASLSPGPAELLRCHPGRVCGVWFLRESNTVQSVHYWSDSARCRGCSGAVVVLRGCDRALLRFSCQQPLASGTAHASPRKPPGKSWSEFSPCLARDKSFKALGKEFETPPKFAANTYQMGGSQAASV